jgi:hypothetical protein
MQVTNLRARGVNREMETQVTIIPTTLYENVYHFCLFFEYDQAIPTDAGVNHAHWKPAEEASNAAQTRRWKTKPEWNGWNRVVLNHS